MTQTPYKCKYFQARKMACIEVHLSNEKKNSCNTQAVGLRLMSESLRL